MACLQHFWIILVTVILMLSPDFVHTSAVHNRRFKFFRKSGSKPTKANYRKRDNSMGISKTQTAGIGGVLVAAISAGIDQVTNSKYARALVNLVSGKRETDLPHIPTALKVVKFQDSNITSIWKNATSELPTSQRLSEPETLSDLGWLLLGLVLFGVLIIVLVVGICCCFCENSPSRHALKTPEGRIGPKNRRSRKQKRTSRKLSSPTRSSTGTQNESTKAI